MHDGDWRAGGGGVRANSSNAAVGGASSSMPSRLGPPASPDLEARFAASESPVAFSTLVPVWGGFWFWFKEFDYSTARLSPLGPPMTSAPVGPPAELPRSERHQLRCFQLMPLTFGFPPFQRGNPSSLNLKEESFPRKKSLHVPSWRPRSLERTLPTTTYGRRDGGVS